MVIRINGNVIAAPAPEVELREEIVRTAPNLRRIAITWWITAGAMLVNAKKAAAASTTNDDSMDSTQIMSSFQDIVLAFGALAIVIGLILLVVKKKWGVKTLTMTGYITAGVFLAPALLLLVAIISMSINDHLYTTFQQMRAHHTQH